MYVLGAKDTEVRETENNPWPQYNEILMIIEFLSLPQNKACIRRHFFIYNFKSQYEKYFMVVNVS